MPPPGTLARLRAGIATPLLGALLGNATLRTFLARSRSEPVEGNTLDPYLAAMLRLDDVTHDSDYTRSTPDEARTKLSAAIPISAAGPDAVIETRDLTWDGPAGPRSARLYVPEGLSDPSPGILFLHGGGWVTGDIDSHDTTCRHLAAHGALRVLSVDYRLAPEHPFPAAAEDAVAAFAYARDHATELGLDPARIGVAGDSAGGNLSAVVALHHASSSDGPALAALLYPALDATRELASHATFAERWFLTRPMVDWYYDHYLGKGGAHARDPRASPLHAPDLGGVCPMFLYPCHFDPLRDEALAFEKRLHEAGVTTQLRCYGSFIHGFALMTRACPAALTALTEIAVELGAFLRGAR
jgi:acetyl esterase